MLPTCYSYLDHTMEQMNFSARAHDRILQFSRTIAGKQNITDNCNVPEYFEEKRRFMTVFPNPTVHMNSKSLFATLLAFVCMLAPVMSEIEAGQSVIVKIMGVPAEEKERINETYPISEKGLINLPFIGELPAAGLEAGELAKSIQDKYKRDGYFSDAVIQIIANQEGIAPQEQRVHLGGNVSTPGPSPFRKGLTIFQAVSAGGGPTPYGAMNRVVILRKGKQQIINLKKPEGKTVLAEADDVIEVPQKDWLGN